MTRKYSWLAAASVVPLLIVIVLLALFQLAAQRAQLLEELEEQAVAHNILLSSIVKTVQDHVRTLAAWGEVYWTQSERHDAPPPAAAGARTIADGRRVIQGPGFFNRPTAGIEARLAANLSRHMRLSRQAMPYLRWSYYVSAQGDLLSVVPFTEGQSFGGALRGAGPDHQALRPPSDHGPRAGRGRARARLDRGLRRSGRSRLGGRLCRAGGERRTPARGGGRRGAARFPHQVPARLRLPGWAALAGRRPAAGAGAVRRGQPHRQRPRQLADVLPEGLRALEPARLLTPSPAFRELGGAHVLAQGVGSTPWTLLYGIAPAELNAVILPRLVPYGIILLGLILTLLLAHTTAIS